MGFRGRPNAMVDLPSGDLVINPIWCMVWGLPHYGLFNMGIYGDVSNSSIWVFSRMRIMRCLPTKSRFNRGNDRIYWAISPRHMILGLFEHGVYIGITPNGSFHI